MLRKGKVFMFGKTLESYIISDPNRKGKRKDTGLVRE